MEENKVTCDECNRILTRDINGERVENYPYLMIKKIEEHTNYITYHLLDEGQFCNTKCLATYIEKKVKGIYSDNSPTDKSET